LFYQPTGEKPKIDITMALNKDKELITTFTHKQTHESVSFVGLNFLTGSEITLQEWKQEYAAKGTGTGDVPSGGDAPSRRRDWTKKSWIK